VVIKALISKYASSEAVLSDDMKAKKMSPKEKAAYVEKLLEDFDHQSER
jgi:hypothetical protein